MKKAVISLICICLAVCCLAGCHKQQKPKKSEQIVTAKLQTPVQRLYYSGTLSPISATPVVSPVAGVVSKLYFSYGAKVVKGEKLLVIDSKSLASKYHSTVKAFLQAKQTYSNAKISFSGNEALYKAGIIARENYLDDQATFNTAALSFYQSRYQLEKLLQVAKIDVEKIETLSISDTQRVNQLLEKHFRHIDIYSPVEGVALYPSSSSSDGSGSTLSVGSEIKEEGKLLLLIGDLSGLSAKFKVSEIDVDRIHKGMKVIVQSSAFPDITLHGYISSVSSQATQSGSGLSEFSVAVKIPKLTVAARDKIRVGMTAKFQIDIKSKKAVMLPVNAVFEKNGESKVTLIDAKGVKKEVSVVTGATTPSSVVIEQGVKPGDRVVVHD